MAITVEISDRGNWQSTYRESAEWLIAHFPELCLASKDPNRVYNGWDVSFGLDTILFHFDDPQAAVLFKLTFA